MISFFLSPIIGALVALGSERNLLPSVVNFEAQRLCDLAVEKSNGKDYENAIKDTMQALALQPNYANAQYNLACFYSRLENRAEAFKYLALAIENGYHNFEEIQSDPDLEFLRHQFEYPEFVAKGYKYPQSPTDSTDIVGKLEKLAALKEKGLLSDSEFQEQRRIALNNI